MTSTAVTLLHFGSLDPNDQMIFAFEKRSFWIVE